MVLPLLRGPNNPISVMLLKKSECTPPFCPDPPFLVYIFRSDFFLVFFWCICPLCPRIKGSVKGKNPFFMCFRLGSRDIPPSSAIAVLDVPWRASRFCGTLKVHVGSALILERYSCCSCSPKTCVFSCLFFVKKCKDWRVGSSLPSKG